MRSSIRFAAKQALAIFLLVGTLAARIFPPGLAQRPREMLMEATATCAGPVYTLAASLTDLPGWDSPSREELQKRIDRLTAQLAASRAEVRRLRAQIESANGFRSLPVSELYLSYSGEIVGLIRGGDSSVFNRTYLVNLGARQGVEKGCPAVWGRYAVGVVSEASSDHCRVRVLGDPLSRVPVRFAKSRHQGVLVGGGRQVCRVRFVPNRAAGSISEGDYVMTSGAGRVFPPGLVVGRVVKFFRRPSEPSADVEVELLVDFGRVESCLILKRKRPVGEE